MAVDTHDSAALAHYEQLIAQRYPPHLAALLAAARYQAELIRAKEPARLDELLEGAKLAQAVGLLPTDESRKKTRRPAAPRRTTAKRKSS